jgi:hypothetical protein
MRIIIPVGEQICLLTNRNDYSHGVFHLTRKKLKNKQMKKPNCLLCIIFFLLLAQLSASADPKLGDSINVPRIIASPLIDGLGTDGCWDSAAWNPMPYVWMPYGQAMAASDFTGRFKSVWNEQKSLMYFLFEITDDKFVNGYVFSSTNGTYYLYDVVEVFIDENHSGGNHETNNNAFAYHITGGNSTVDYDAIDIWGSSRVNYRDHFPEFKRNKNGNVYTWEFSLMVVTDAFTPGSSPAAFKSTLKAGKEMGFTAAYCDDDQSSANPQRDNFIGSKYLTQANSDNSWKDASVFGYMKLVNEPTANPVTAINHLYSETPQLKVYPNPATESAFVSFINQYTGKVDISVLNTAGQQVSKIISYKSKGLFEQKIKLDGLKPGSYVIKVNAGKEHMSINTIKQ